MALSDGGLQVLDLSSGSSLIIGRTTVIFKRGGGYVTIFTKCKAVGSRWLFVRAAKAKLRDLDVRHRTCPEKAMQEASVI